MFMGQAQLRAHCRSIHLITRPFKGANGRSAGLIAPKYVNICQFFRQVERFMVMTVFPGGSGNLFMVAIPAAAQITHEGFTIV